MLDRTAAYLASLSEDDLDRVVDDNWDPPVTLGVRLMSIIADDLQHAGQAALLRGIILRRAAGQAGAGPFGAPSYRGYCSVTSPEGAPKPMDVGGATALVTGGASGLGLATATRLVTEGGSVVVVDLPGSAGADVADRLGDRARFVAADVTAEDDVRAALDAAADLGELRVVVNCAGVGPAAKVLGRDGVHELELFSRTVQINLVGTFNVLRLAAERIAALDLLGEERGVIVNTASVAAFDGQIGQAAYSASKGGVVGLTLPIARELAERQIRVVTIAPGIFETPMLAALPDAARESLGKQVPHPSRLGRPDEYAALVAHIVSNPMLNGDTIRLDGAIRMAPR